MGKSSERGEREKAGHENTVTVAKEVYICSLGFFSYKGQNSHLKWKMKTESLTWQGWAEVDWHQAWLYPGAGANPHSHVRVSPSVLLFCFLFSLMSLHFYFLLGIPFTLSHCKKTSSVEPGRLIIPGTPGTPRTQRQEAVNLKIPSGRC